MMFRWLKLAFWIVVVVETDTERDPKMAPMLWEEAKNLCDTYKEIKYLNVIPQIPNIEAKWRSDTYKEIKCLNAIPQTLILKQNEEVHMPHLEKSYHFRAVISL